MASSHLLAFLNAVVLVGAGFMHDPPETRIINGHEIEIEDAPWQVALLYNGRLNCGGSIIGARWILSAAHCTFGMNVSEIEVLVGTKSLEEGGTKYSVAHVVEHEEYNVDGKYSNDICVLYTRTDMKLDLPVKAVTLPDADAPRPAVETQLRVSGWGLLEDRSPTTLLRAVDVFVRNFTECKAKDDPTAICTGPIGKGFCSGDSGGPLTKGDLLVGVVSYHYGPTTLCVTNSHIYTYVAAYRNWIKAHTGQ